MPQLQRLLAATDLSAPARHAAERGALVAKDASAELRLVHVISDPVLNSLRRLLEEPDDDIEQRLRRRIAGDVARLGEHLEQAYGVPATADVVTAPLVDGILRNAAAHGADLLVLGARGASFMRHLMLGSTAERLVRKSDRPLLVVRQPPHERYRRVLVAVDFSPSSPVALQLARAVAPRANVVALHVYDVPYEDWMQSSGVGAVALRHYRDTARQRALQDMQAFLASAGPATADVPTVVIKGDPTERILEQEQELDCDLIVVGRQGETAPEEFLLGSVTKHILQKSQADVLVAA